jgi:hypothetical protein
VVALYSAVATGFATALAAFVSYVVEGENEVIGEVAGYTAAGATTLAALNLIRLKIKNVLAVLKSQFSGAAGAAIGGITVGLGQAEDATRLLQLTSDPAEDDEKKD